MQSSNSDSLPLKGVTVISLEHAIAAPFCTRQLADMGARVIKIERPGVGDFARGYDERVDGLSSHFVWTNRSKESLTLNLKAGEAKSVLHKLLGEADVLVQNLAPGAAERLGISWGALKDRYPNLIVCNISGYGDSGPYRFRKAYDLLIQSEGGFLSTTGFPGEDGMAKAGCSIADISAGMYAYSSILSALLLRNKKGAGSCIDISMLECLVEWMGFPLYYAYKGAEPPPRAGASHAAIYPYGPFQAGDGKQVMLGLQNEREWSVFCDKVLKKAELKTDTRFESNRLRSENRDALREIIHEAFSEMSSSQVADRLDEAGIANAKVNDMHDVWEHPQLHDRNHWRKVDSASGALPAPLPPGRSSAFEPVMEAVPELGEHSESILSELGFNADEIRGFKADGTI